MPGRLISLIRALVLLCGIAGTAGAETVTVRSGDHQGFVRFVFTSQAGVSLTVAPAPGRITLRTGSDAVGFDLSRAFTRIGRTRVTAITRPQPGGIDLLVDCDCRYQVTPWRGSGLILDIHDAQSLPNGLPIPMHSHAHRPVTRPASHTLPPARQGRVASWAEQLFIASHVAPAPPRPAPAPPPQPAQAMSAGVELRRDITAVPVTRYTLHVEADCLAPVWLDPTLWAPPENRSAPLRGVTTDAGGATDSIRRLIALGLFVEARQVLHAAGPDPGGRAIYAELLDFMSGAGRDFPMIAAQVQCGPEGALWAQMVSLADDHVASPRKAMPVLRVLQSWPAPMRAAIEARLGPHPPGGADGFARCLDSQACNLRWWRAHMAGLDQAEVSMLLFELRGPQWQAGPRFAGLRRLLDLGAYDAAMAQLSQPWADPALGRRAADMVFFTLARDAGDDAFLTHALDCGGVRLSAQVRTRIEARMRGYGFSPAAMSFDDSCAVITAPVVAPPPPDRPPPAPPPAPQGYAALLARVAAMRQGLAVTLEAPTAP